MRRVPGFSGVQRLLPILLVLVLFLATGSGSTGVARDIVGLDVSSTGITLVQPQGQVVPTGIERIGGITHEYTGTNWVDADVAILDTGVDFTHEDLNVVGGTDCTGMDNWSDGNGHGTHVAGTLGALDNDVGVVGVAPGVRIWSVKVLDAHGYGEESWMECGIQWVRDHADTIDVAHMSLGFPTCERLASDPFWGWGRSPYTNINTTVYNECIDGRVRQADLVHQSNVLGVTWVVAAGNEGISTTYSEPANWPGVISVAALADFDGVPGGVGLQPGDDCAHGQIDDTLAEWSNHGEMVDIAAPGTCILSTFPGDRYAYFSGTSMAAPHITGMSLLLAALPGTMYPWQIELRIKMSAREYGELAAPVLINGTIDWAYTARMEFPLYVAWAPGIWVDPTPKTWCLPEPPGTWGMPDYDCGLVDTPGISW